MRVFGNALTVLSEMIPPSHHGRFVGQNRLFLMPGTPASLSEGILEVSLDRIKIHWSYEGVARVGEIVLRGPAPACRCDFIDSFHASDGMQFHGCVRGKEALFYGTFSVGEGSPDWGWRIVLDWFDPDMFSFRMFVVKADGSEALSVDLRASRSSEKQKAVEE